MSLRLRVVPSIRSLDASLWHELQSPDFPFTDYRFFEVLEATASVGDESGWQPLYIIAEDESGRYLGALYAYAKSHSYGEYIFDWEWARFYAQHGQRYYPKLLSAVPFTPATGPRLLLRAGVDRQAISQALIQAALQLTREAKMSSYHALFITEEEAAVYREAGLSIRSSMQYHWSNQGYRDFKDYLDNFIGKRRRDIVRERQRAQSHGLTIERVTGAELKAEHGLAMEQLYLTTAEKKDAIPYLQAGFFTALFAAMPEHILLVTAREGDSIVAASLNLFKGSALYGRYWGSTVNRADLHFELCYYQTLDFALERGMQRFEAGAQGEHKMQRGFLPSLTRSAHILADPDFNQAIATYIRSEATAVKEAMEKLQASSPFRQGLPAGSS